MTQLVPHAGLVHLPLALALIVPLMYAMAWLGTRRGWLNGNVWYGVVFFALLQLVSIVVGLQSGEAAEFTSAAAKEAIERHERAAESFFYVWIALGILLIGAVWIRGRKYFPWVESAILLLFAIQMYLAFSTGHFGGDLISR